MPALPGEVLVNRYRIVNLLGQGQFGVVYRAWDTTDKRDVAIKEYLDTNPRTRQLFSEEVRKLSRIKHARLPEILDTFTLEETGLYFVSEYIEGVDLQSLIDQYGPLPPHYVVAIIQGVVRPLTQLHSEKQLHLNIKPANIRITPRGDIYLVDSGLPGMGTPVGTSGYAPPEQQQQLQVDRRSDIYSLGATMYAALTGTKPADALRQHSGLAYVRSARERNLDVPPYLSAVAARAMSLKPEARFDSAEEMSRALSTTNQTPAIYTQGTILRTPDKTGGTPRMVNRRSRRQMEQRTIIALLIILIALISGAWAISYFNLRGTDVEVPFLATAVFQSEVAGALTAIAPTSTPLPPPTVPPTATPQTLIHLPTKARMLFIPGGQFSMGDDEGEEDEQPAHTIRLDDFFFDETEVTNGQYAICVEDGACPPPQRNTATYHPAYFGSEAFADYPVVHVTWNHAQAFCEWRDARLPTEAEWEYVAGYDPDVAIKLNYPWGIVFDGTQLNFCDINCPSGAPDWNDGHADTAPAMSFPDGRSPYGAYNMSGNVYEWVLDWYSTDYYGTSVEINPYGPLEGEAKVIRGGSWLSDEADVSVVARGRYLPAVARANVGFRCATSAE